MNKNSYRKFQFFDIIEGEEKIKKNTENEIKTFEEKKDNQTILDSNISISNISPYQMFAIDGIIFLSGYAIYKRDEKIIREYLIMKILLIIKMI